MAKLRAVILGNELENDHIQWVDACERHSDHVEYRVVNLTSNSWFKDIKLSPADVMLAKPGGLTGLFKQMYDERIFILSCISGYRIFPSPLEISIYENKRILSYWLQANLIPHPSTDVFYSQQEAMTFANSASYPIVAKTNIGASGSGVRILKSNKEAADYITGTFRGKGSPQRTGPNLEKGGIMVRGLHYLIQPLDIARKLNIYSIRASNLQKGFVIFQEYIPHEYEWRVVRIGDSFFAHKKLKIHDKASGSLFKRYDNPPLEILDFVRVITDKYYFYSQAVDIFESDRGYLVNEMQCIFGQSDPYQMMVDGEAGRYRYTDNYWVFEEGDWARNQCYDLRLEFLLTTRDTWLK